MQRPRAPVAQKPAGTSVAVLAPKLSGGECSVFVGAASTILYNDRSFQDRDATNSAHRKQHGH